MRDIASSSALSSESGSASGAPAVIEVRYCAQAATVAGKHRESVRIPSGLSLDDLLRQLIARHGALTNLLRVVNDRPAAPVLIFVNDQQVDLAHPPALRDNDQVIILAPMAGG